MLGTAARKVVVSDRLRSYSWIKRRQSCWAHYLREAAKPVYEADRHAKVQLNTPTTTLQKAPRGALNKRARAHPIDDPDHLPVHLHATDRGADDRTARRTVRLP